jgi:hypothetical protein
MRRLLVASLIRPVRWSCESVGDQTRSLPSPGRTAFFLEVGVKHGGDGGDVGPFGIDHQEVA